jgi:hypothetical protein
MKYTMTKPCTQCPFSRTGIVLRPAAMREVVGQFADGTGGQFPCHKTAELQDGMYVEKPGDGSQHCIGALAFAEKHMPTQMMRIAERLQMYNPEAAIAAGPLVYDSLAEALTASKKVHSKKKKKKDGK